MEAHIVRPRKKQHRSKDQKKRYDNAAGGEIVVKEDYKNAKSSERGLVPVSLDAIEVKKYLFPAKRSVLKYAREN